MLHSHTRIYIHLIWATKNRERLFFNEIRKKTTAHLIEKAKSEAIPFISLNIQPEHVHGLINLPTDKCLADFMQKIKGECSFWINQFNLFPGKFNWGRGYGGYSVSASQLETVKRYIQNQDAHHRGKSFIEEYETWKKEYGTIAHKNSYRFNNRIYDVRFSWKQTKSAKADYQISILMKLPC